MAKLTDAFIRSLQVRKASPTPRRSMTSCTGSASENSQAARHRFSSSTASASSSAARRWGRGCLARQARALHIPSTAPAPCLNAAGPRWAVAGTARRSDCRFRSYLSRKASVGLSLPTPVGGPSPPDTKSSSSALNSRKSVIIAPLIEVTPGQSVGAPGCRPRSFPIRRQAGFSPTPHSRL
jgi:hypothetical protein